MSSEAALIVSERAMQPVVITSEQTDLIKATIAPDATDAELQLFFFDCRRRGVHPLDKLIHFTKRKGKYTPVTSIDFFRSRAAETNLHMGTDDAVFSGTPGTGDFEASVTVYRYVQGEKCPFTATARWAEYVPDATNDFMWQKMKHGQLAKCAEALALRKAFPQELASLYTFEEMDQATEPTAARTPKQVTRASATTSSTSATSVATPSTGGFLTAAGTVKDVRIFGKAKDNYALTLHGDPAEYTTKDAKLAGELEQFKGTDHKILVTFEDREWQGKTYHNIKTFAIADVPPPQPPARSPAMTAADIPF